MRKRVLWYLILFAGMILLNLYLLGEIEQTLLERNSFDYEKAFENFRDETLTEETVAFLRTGKQVSWEVFSERLAVYFSMDGVKNMELLQKGISCAKQYQPEKFEAIRSRIEAMWTDAVCFPVGPVANDRNAVVEYGNSWKQDRTFGGNRVHEGCDLMASVNKRGIYPVYSVSDGVVEKIGWLRLGGYRIGIRSEHGVYFYYAHLAEYAKNFQPGERVEAGTLLGFMGDTGYSDKPGTTGNFPVHLHFGIYFESETGKEFSVNPYPLLRYLDTQEKGEKDATDNLPYE